MASDRPKQSLFSSLALGRAPRAPKSAPETVAHPLLGASSSSLNLAEAAAEQSTQGRQVSFASRAEALGLPYKPRQRLHQHGSTSTLGSFSGTGVSSSPNFASTVTSTSPVTPTAMPTTSTSLSTSFDLPPSASEPAEPSASATLPSSSTATSQLQRQSLKAAAQKIGLGNGSMGMSMIDAISEKSQAGRAKAGEGEWGDLLRTLMAGKAILLLPTTPSSSLPMTPQTLKDHIAFLSPPVPSTAPVLRLEDNKATEKVDNENVQENMSVIVTLSGLVGTLRGSNVIIESAIPTDSALLRSLRDSPPRPSSISSLRPTVPRPDSSAVSFPSYHISRDSASLPFSILPKTLVPTTASSETKEEKVPIGKLGRMNPFAGFFAASGSASSPSKTGEHLIPDRPTSPPTSRPTSPSPLSPKLSVFQFDQSDADFIHSKVSATQTEGYQISAFTVSKPIRYADIHKALSRAVKAFVREELSNLPDGVIERIFNLVVTGVCPHSGSGGVQDTSGTNQGILHDLALQVDFGDPPAAGDKIQNIMEGVYDDLVTEYRADASRHVSEGTLRRRVSGSISWSKKGDEGDAGEAESERKERRERARRQRDEYAEKEATEGTERAEAVVCRLLYNRLFSPSEADDSRHDEALASRIAALNMLDLTLDHLGLMTRTFEVDADSMNDLQKGLAALVERVGLELQQLSSPACLTPKQKTDALIRAHKIVVEGLALLPSIELRPEGEPYKPPDDNSRPPLSDPTVAIGLLPEPILSDLDVKSSDMDPGSSQPAETHLDIAARPIYQRKASGSASLLSSSPAGMDPLTASNSSRPNPEVDPASDSDANGTIGDIVEPQLEEAMADSVLTITGPRMSKGSSASSTAPDTSHVPAEVGQKRQSGTSGADLILPIIIFAVVKSNPPQLASQLMYLRRYRSAICLTGEASYAIVNLTAVVEFLEHVQLADLGLGPEGDKVISVADLSPIGLDYLDESNADAASIASASSRLRGRVFQVSELAGTAAGSANKVISGVIDSSWTAVRGLMAVSTANELPSESGDGTLSPAVDRPEAPHQRSTFSLANVTASVANIAAVAAASTVAARTRSRASSRASALIAEERKWGGNQELQDVSRDASIRGNDLDEESEEIEEDVPSDQEQADHELRKSDSRSIRSVSSMMQDSKREEQDLTRDARVTISDRLASASSGLFGKLGSPAESESIGGTQPSKPTGYLSSLTGSRNPLTPQGRRSSLSSGLAGDLKRMKDGASPGGSTTSLVPSFPTPTANEPVDPPIERFMTCDLGDIRLSEVYDLLRDYRRLGTAVNAINSQRLASGAPS